MAVMLDPTNLYHAGSPTGGFLNQVFRDVGPDGTKKMLVAIFEDMITIGTTNGTIGSIVTALTTVRDGLDTEATFNIFVAPYL